MITGEFLGYDQPRVTAEMQGVTRMLQEAGHQFDMIDSSFDFSKYKLIVMPDLISVDKGLNKKLQKYMNNGGKVVASFESCLNADKTSIGFQGLGMTLNDKQSRDIITGELVRGKVYPLHQYADYIIPEGEIGKGLPETEHVMYLRGLEAKANKEDVLVRQITPYFDRNYQHFCSHQQTPASKESTYDAVIKNKNAIYFAHPIFKVYSMYAPKWCKVMFLNAIDMLLKEPLLRHDGPSTVLATINEQSNCGRYVVHILHYIPERRSQLADIIEDIIPLYNLEISLNLPKEVKAVRLVPEGKDLNMEVENNRVKFTVPKIEGHQMIEIKYNNVSK